jgi:hypothetical protein
LPSQLKAKLLALELVVEVEMLEASELDAAELRLLKLELTALEFVALEVETTATELDDSTELAARELSATAAEELTELFTLLRLLALDALEGTVAGADEVAPPDEPPPQADITLAIANVKKTLEKFMLDALRLFFVLGIHLTKNDR